MIHLIPEVKGQFSIMIRKMKQTEEPILNEAEIEHLRSEDSESTRQYESEFVQFDGDYILYFLDINRQRPIFNPMMSKVSRSFAST